MTNEINVMNPEFNTREEYLEYRSAWRAEYRVLSKEIRQKKIKVKNQQRAGEYTDHYSLRQHRIRANQMMIARAAATARMIQQRASVPAE